MDTIKNVASISKLNVVSKVLEISKKNLPNLVWNGDSDKAVAVSIGAVQNNGRQNASGPKITSNAHSDEFPGIYFIWDSKQKDSGYLKVSASVFEIYQSFTLTAKEANLYWDFVIGLKAGQQKTADNCYVFFIPKANNNSNINMVFLSEFVEKIENPVIPEPPAYDKEQYIHYHYSGWTNMPQTIVSAVNPQGIPYQDLWNSAIGRDNYYFTFSEYSKAHGRVISIAPNWMMQTNGSTHMYGEILGNIITDAKLTFAAVNCPIALWLNGNLVGKTKATEIIEKPHFIEAQYTPVPTMIPYLNVVKKEKLSYNSNLYGLNGVSEVVEVDFKTLRKYIGPSGAASMHVSWRDFDSDSQPNDGKIRGVLFNLLIKSKD